MESNRKKEIKTLIIRLAALAAIVIGVILVVKLVKSFTSSSDTAIVDTPLRVEQVKAILELNTIRFRDEVVADTVELYKSTADQGLNHFDKLTDFNTIDEFFKTSPIKRRLTLVVKGELLYGVNLKTGDFDINDEGDTLIIQLPEPELLSATVNPSNTDVFVENGVWSDYARRKLMLKAKRKMIQNGEDLHLPLKAKEPLEKTLKQLVHTDKPIKIVFIK